MDRSSDIWAFGVVLYEMLARRNPFQRDPSRKHLAAVRKEDVNLEKVPVGGARPMIERCLRKDPRGRWQSIGDARIAIEEPLAGPPEEPQRTPPWAFALIAAVLVAVSMFERDKPQPSPVQFSVDLSFPREPILRVSPNGESILFVAQDTDRNMAHAYLYPLATGATRELPGTEETNDGSSTDCFRGRVLFVGTRRRGDRNAGRSRAVSSGSDRFAQR